MKIVKRFHTKYLTIKEQGRTVQLHIDHGAGRLDFELTTPLQISVAVAIQRPQRRRAK
jgi:hypothetical protein